MRGPCACPRGNPIRQGSMKKTGRIRTRDKHKAPSSTPPLVPTGRRSVHYRMWSVKIIRKRPPSSITCFDREHSLKVYAGLATDNALPYNTASDGEKIG